MSEYNIDRFIKAQREYFERALSEIKSGRKRSHWMWFIFPQLRDLGQSHTAIYYGISGIDEAKEYIQNDYLRENLIAITCALLALEENDPNVIMGRIDALKLCSCMTLFEVAEPNVEFFSKAIEKFYGGTRDKNTLRLLQLN